MRWCRCPRSSSCPLRMRRSRSTSCSPQGSTPPRDTPSMRSTQWTRCSCCTSLQDTACILTVHCCYTCLHHIASSCRIHLSFDTCQQHNWCTMLVHCRCKFRVDMCCSWWLLSRSTCLLGKSSSCWMKGRNQHCRRFDNKTTILAKTFGQQGK